MVISEICIHASILNKFKIDALKSFPQEHIQGILGKQIGRRLDIYALVDLSGVEAIGEHLNAGIAYYRPGIEIEEDTNLKYFGTIHSHPAGFLNYSDTDLISFCEGINENHEEFEYINEVLFEHVMGIFKINKLENGCQWGIVFYNSNIEYVPVMISEI